jgi:hypothetical protein
VKSGHHCPDRDVKNPGRICVGQIFHRNEQHDAALLLRRSVQRTEHLLEMQPFLLCCWLGDLGFVDTLQLRVGAAPPRLAQAVERQVVQDGEDSRPGIAARLTLIPAGNDPLQAILYQVISHAASRTWARAYRRSAGINGSTTSRMSFMIRVPSFG